LAHNWGYLSAVAAAASFGVSSALNKIALQNVHPTIVAGMIYSIGGLILFSIRVTPLGDRILSLLETPETELKISAKDFRTLAFAIVCGSVGAPLLFLNGLNQTTAINASLLLNAESLFTALIAFVFLSERGTRKEYLGMLMLIIGVVFVTTNGEFQKLSLMENVTGNLLVVGACLLWGIENNLSKFLSKKRDIILIIGLRCFVGGSALLAIAFAINASFSIPMISIPYMLFVGAFSVAFSMISYLFSLRKIGSMRAGVIFSMSSFFGAVIAFLILRESFTVVQLVAGAITVAGVYTLYLYGKRK
jgi:drug/metabolite transporter (DMT)-like permease